MSWKDAPVVSNRKASWQDAPVVGSWQSAPIVRAEQPGVLAKVDAGINNALPGLKTVSPTDPHSYLGAAETVGNLATFLPRAFGATVYGSVESALHGINAYPSAFWKAMHATQIPENHAGRTYSKAVSLPFNYVANKANQAGQYVTKKTGSPVLGTLTDVGINALPLIVGDRIGKAGSALRDMAKRKPIETVTEEPPAPKLLTHQPEPMVVTKAGTVAKPGDLAAHLKTLTPEQRAAEMGLGAKDVPQAVPYTIPEKPAPTPPQERTPGPIISGAEAEKLLKKPGFMRTPEEQIRLSGFKDRVGPEAFDRFQAGVEAMNKPGFQRDAVDQMNINVARGLSSLKKQRGSLDLSVAAEAAIKAGKSIKTFMDETAKRYGEKMRHAARFIYLGAENRLNGATPRTDVIDTIASRHPADLTNNLAENVTPSGDIEKDLQVLKNRRQLDSVKMTEFLKAAQEDGLDAEMNQRIFDHYEDPTIRLTPEETAIKEKYLDPIRQELGLTPGYMPREAIGHGGFFDRLNAFSDRARQNFMERLMPRTEGAGMGILRTRTPSMRRRVFKAIEDEKGNRHVVAIHNEGGTKKLTRFENKKAVPFVQLKLKSNLEMLDKELAPVEKQVHRLETEKRTLERNRGTRKAAARRLENIKKTLMDLDSQARGIIAKHSGEDLNGKAFRDRHGNKYTIKEATAREIEQHTHVKYHKNAIASLAREYITRRQAERQAAYLEALKDSPEFQKIATKGEAPTNWKPVNMPQFAGYKFDPYHAEVLNHFARMQSRTDLLDLPGLTGLNELLTRSMFSVLSVWHDFNIADITFMTRGLSSWATPQGYIRLWKTLGPAIKDVMTLSPEYQRLFAKGVAFKRIGAVQEAAYKTMVESVARELETKPEGSMIAEAMGYGPKQLANVLRWWGHHQQTTMWTFNDIVAMQSIKENMLKGLSEDDAIQRTFETMPDYRMPTGYKSLNLVSHPNVTWFAKYHFGIFRAYGNLMKRLLSRSSTLADRARAMDQLAAVGVMAFVVYPMIDTVIQKTTHNPKARIHRFGLTAVPYDLYRLSTGQRSLTAELESILTPAQGTLEIAQQFFDRDLYSGHPIAPYYDTTAEKWKDRVEHALESPIIVNQAMQARSPLGALGSQFGIYDPQERNPVQDILDKRQRVLKERAYFGSR